jgi:hypothetical protein
MSYERTHAISLREMAMETLKVVHRLQTQKEAALKQTFTSRFTGGEKA